MCTQITCLHIISAINSANEDVLKRIQDKDVLLVGHDQSPIPTSPTFSYISSKLYSVDETIAELKPSVPLYCLRPKTIEATAAWFVSTFPGQVLYALKCNPEPQILQMLWNGGIRHFDCSSLKEIELIHALLPSAKAYFMHPIKTRNSIYKAYFHYGIRDYALDSIEELHKIIEVTANANDLSLLVRIKVPENVTLIDLSHKYGASAADAVDILRQARPVAKNLGICFHVGSQCLNPECYESALAVVKGIITQANVKIDIIDVGGGFPERYPHCVLPSRDLFMLAIKRGFQDLNLTEKPALWCEPGRALVCAGCSLVVTVLARRKDVLYINDGVYGNLSDAGKLLNWRYPVRLVRRNEPTSAVANELKSFTFYGPTCDSIDVMKGPFVLPDDVKVDDYIEIGQTGAYNSALKTSFNGFDETKIVLVNDDFPITALEH
ncbi:unnamed protein product [Rotaria magnacalcarata]|uniref:ornithine decarboxylase n=2 Tax=Rotaria magnacalcarata TaxID=392030 RepID=A0A815EHL7_9BILA|nr:unnamed protein product [Rotaria magnacalcarata]